MSDKVPLERVLTHKMSGEPRVNPLHDSRELVIRLPAGRDALREFAGGVAECFTRPSFRAGLVGSTVAGAVCMRQGMRPLPAFLIMLMAHYAAEGLYGMAEDIRDNVAALVSRETASGAPGAL